MNQLAELYAGADLFSLLAVAITQVMGDPELRARMSERSVAIDESAAGSEVGAFAGAVFKAAGL